MRFGDIDLLCVEIDGEPWFVATDVCRVLGHDLAKGTTNHLKKLEDHEVIPVPLNLLRGKGMNQAKLISESGLYKLIMRSDKPEAKEFRQCVSATGLPSIRTDGFVITLFSIGACEADRRNLLGRYALFVIGTH